ncbi:MAG: sulfite exporter TauE/SafE family protein [Candidatus Eremiobacteraeota bacterium]|nr:sulfite exporter TauE/SafE family protein [Candidatus Eremiobacteraeota bacterium]
MKILLFLLLLLSPARAHETGRLPADSRTEVTVGASKIGVDYSILFQGPAAAAEWGELDRDHDGLLSEAEVEAYHVAEAKFLDNAFVLEGQASPPGTFRVEGDSQKLTLHRVWEWPSSPGPSKLVHPGVQHLAGKHHYRLQLAAPGGAQFQARDLPTLSWENLPAGQAWVGEWDWSNAVGELDGLLQGKTLWAALLLAFGLGAVHALTPGHGKTIVGAYLVGSRGTVPQAILLGIVVTVTHTFSVILLGLACLFFFQKYLPPTLIPWIGVVSGFLMTLLGLTLISGEVPSFIHHHHDDEDGHHHHHHHHMPDKLTLGGLISLGITGGMVPCPEALAVLLTALALNKLAFGLLILLAFSSGLAAVLVAIGIVMVSAARVLEKRYPSKTMISRLSDLSYTTMIVMGMVIAIRSYLNTL